MPTADYFQPIEDWRESKGMTITQFRSLFGWASSDYSTMRTGQRPLSAPLAVLLYIAGCPAETVMRVIAKLPPVEDTPAEPVEEKPTMNLYEYLDELMLKNNWTAEIASQKLGQPREFINQYRWRYKHDVDKPNRGDVRMATLRSLHKHGVPVDVLLGPGGPS